MGLQIMLKCGWPRPRPRRGNNHFSAEGVRLDQMGPRGLAPLAAVQKGGKFEI